MSSTRSHRWTFLSNFLLYANRIVGRIKNFTEVSVQTPPLVWKNCNSKTENMHPSYLLIESLLFILFVIIIRLVLDRGVRLGKKIHTIFQNNTLQKIEYLTSKVMSNVPESTFYSKDLL